MFLKVQAVNNISHLCSLRDAVFENYCSVGTINSCTGKAACHIIYFRFPSRVRYDTPHESQIVHVKCFPGDKFTPRVPVK